MKILRRLNEAHSLYVLMLGFLLIGSIMIFSASSVKAYQDYGNSFYFLYRHLISMIIGVALFVIASNLSYRKLRKLVFPAVIGSFILLILVLIPGIGTVVGGARRWIDLGIVRFQPSELAKLSLIIFTAKILSDKKNKITKLSELLNPIIPVLGLFCVLIIFQPDFGTIIAIAMNVFVIYFIAGTRLRHLFGMASLSLLAAVAAIMTEGYRLDRIESFLRPWENYHKGGYQIAQSLIAFGSGGISGLGLGNSMQKYSYLPQAHTDFIYAIIGEEFGLIGSATVIMLFVALSYIGFRIAYKAPDRFGKLIAGGLTASIILQAIINMGAVSNVLPVTGIPLPFISFGGTSLIINLVLLGILSNIASSQRIGVIHENNDLHGRNSGSSVSGNSSRSGNRRS